MKIDATNWFFSKLKDDNQCLLYNGNFADEITTELVALSKYNLENQDEKIKVKKRVSFLMAECFQNIIRHGEKTGDKQSKTKDPGFFMTRNAYGKYFIASGNLIDNQNVEVIRKQLDQINVLEKTELKELYKIIVKEGSLSSKGGAGLGFIDMARKSDQKLAYRFLDYNNDFSIFYNQIELKSEIDSPDNELSDLTIDLIIELHRKMEEENILMVQKSDFSRDSILPVLKIIENNIMHEYQDSKLMKKIYHALVELLQNITVHGYSEKGLKEGIFMMFKSGNNYGISTGNYLLNDKKTVLEELIHKVNNLNKDELKKLYMQTLKEGAETASGGAGAGIIDVARLLSDNITYRFTEINNKISFFTLNAII